MELRQLRYFLAVAEELSFSRAAERLHMTQPPLSAQIRQLEEEMGVLLFERSTRSVRITPAGELFFEEAQRLLSGLEQAIRAAKRVGDGQVGRLALGFVPSAASETLPPLLKAFRKGVPDVDVSLHEMTPVQLVQALRRERLDAAFFYLPSGDVPPFGDTTLDSRSVSREPLVVAFPEEHPLTARRRLELKVLAAEPFILVAAHHGSGLRDTILEQCHKAGFMPNVVQEATLVQTIGGLVASGVGVALVPASLRRLQSNGVVYRPIQGETPMVEMGVVWRRDNPSVILRSFLETIAQGQDSDASDRDGDARPPREM